MSTDKYTVKTGRFNYDPETKKVKVCKDKGELSIFSVASISSRMQKERTM
jgi:hypothetical protein